MSALAEITNQPEMEIVTDDSSDDIKPTKTLSFAADLRHSYTSITSRLMAGSKSLHGILELLRLRIDAETQFTNSLKKIIGRSDKLMANFDPEESLRKDGLEALCSDLRNGMPSKNQSTCMYKYCIKYRIYATHCLLNFIEGRHSKTAAINE